MMGYVRPDRCKLVVRQTCGQLGFDNSVGFDSHLRAAAEIPRFAVVADKMEIVNGRVAKSVQRRREVGFAALDLLRVFNDQRKYGVVYLKQAARLDSKDHHDRNRGQERDFHDSREVFHSEACLTQCLTNVKAKIWRLPNLY